MAADEDFQHADLSEPIAGGDFFDGMGEVPSEAEGH